MKYCIGCKHLNLSPREPSAQGSELTGTYGGEEAAMFCAKGYWKEEMGEDATLENFQRAMEKADTCLDFSERADPSTQG